MARLQPKVFSEVLSLNFGFNIAFNKNKILDLGANNVSIYNSTWASAITNDFLLQVGQPLGNVYGYKSAGRYEVSDFDYDAATGKYTLKAGIPNDQSTIGTIVRPGTMKLEDINGDGKIDANDQTVIGNTLPKFTGGFNLNATYKNFDLSATFNFKYGNKVYNANKVAYTSANINSPNGQYRNLSTIMADGTRWTNIDSAGNLVTDPTALAALNANTTMWSPYMGNYILTDWALEDGSFLRLTTLTLGYNLPKDLIAKLKLSKIRLYASAYNLFVLTKYSGMDPEVSTRVSTPLTPGVDWNGYPKSRQIVFGMNFNF